MSMNGSPVQSIVITGTTITRNEPKTQMEDLIVQVNKKAISYEALMDTNKRETVQWQAEFLELQSTVRKKKNRIEDLNKEVEILKTQNGDLAERIHNLTLGSQEAKTNGKIIDALEQAKKEVADQYEAQLIEKTKENDIARKEYEAMENDYNYSMSELEMVIHKYNKKMEEAARELDAKEAEIRKLKAQLAGEKSNEASEAPKTEAIKVEESKEPEEVKDSKYDLSSVFTETKLPYEQVNKLMADFSKRLYNDITSEDVKANTKFINDALDSVSLDRDVALHLLAQALGESYRVLLSDRPATLEHELSMHLLGAGIYANCCHKIAFDLDDDFFNEFASSSEFTEFLRREIAGYLKCEEDNVVIEQSEEEESVTLHLKEPNAKLFELLFSSDFSKHMVKCTKNAVRNIEMVPYLSVLKLTTDQMDSEGDKDYKNYLVGKSRRGGFDYFYPVGWRGFGIKVRDKYDTNKWLQCTTQEHPEWAAAYRAVSPPKTPSAAARGLKADEYRQAYSEAEDVITGEKCGRGIYLSPHIEVAAKDCVPVSVRVEGKKVKFVVVMQCRVNPKGMRIPEKESVVKGWKNDYWIVNSVNDVRPCRILIAQIA
eukprot:TRINITY_DN8950_c0_g1_i1.p1 TRINITY_DN8950_c0_g1~~TRINITY_DN8950_c0_g1_i1.p1  ORF type:complete len:648 (-),score=206.31 TRINITY_DN8950_c0_g1_i1:83-1882(-)